MNTGVHVSFSVMVFLGYVPSNGLVGSDGSFIPSFLRNLHTVLHSGYISLHTYQQCKRAPFSSHPLQHLLFVDFFSLSFFFFLKLLSRVRLFVTPWAIAYHAPPSMGFSREEYWSGLPFPSPGDLPISGIEPGSPTFQAEALTSEPPGKSPVNFLMMAILNGMR